MPTEFAPADVVEDEAYVAEAGPGDPSASADAEPDAADATACGEMDGGAGGEDEAEDRSVLGLKRIVAI